MESPAIFDRRAWTVLLVLWAAAICAYLPIFTANFVYFDDQAYVTENAQVLAGWTWAGVKWAFTTGFMGSWHPLTWLSHMTDVQLFGPGPTGPHAVNLALHLANVGLALVLFQRLTGSLWGSAVGAALFALHPLHVESVAWVAERKDLLSACFGLLALLGYLAFASEARAEDSKSTPVFWRSRNYWLVFIALLFGLMSKPMLVTWPVLFLVMDVFPLRRVGPGKWRPLLMEKLPFFGLALAISVITLKTQNHSEAVLALQDFTLPERLANTVYSLFHYLIQFVWPARLAMFYPLRSISGGEVALAAVILALLSLMAFHFRRSQPWLLMGWIWYLVVIFPVCGLIQTGLQAHADRYTYLPSLGWSLALIMPVAALANRSMSRAFLVVTALCVLSALGGKTYRQTLVWQNSERLFRHALAVTDKNYMAHQGLGEELLRESREAEAKTEFIKALQIYSKLPSARNNLAVILLREGRYNDAVTEFQKVIVEAPNFSMVHFNLAEAYEGLQDLTNAVRAYEIFLQKHPDDYEALLRSGRGMVQIGASELALTRLLRARELAPSDPRILVLLANQFQSKSQYQAAAALYESAIAQHPRLVELNNNLAWLLATCPDGSVRDGERAIRYAEIACAETAHGQPFLLGTLAAAYAEAGQFENAVATAQKAIELAQAAGQADLAARNTELLELYRAHKPYREPVR